MSADGRIIPLQWNGEVSTHRRRRRFPIHLDSPKNGLLIVPQSYVNRDTAFRDGLVYTQDDGTVIIKADDKTQLRRGEYRKRCDILSD